jgi:hypothetical protein
MSFAVDFLQFIFHPYCYAENLETSQNKEMICKRTEAEKKVSIKRWMENIRTDGWIVNDKETIMEHP